MASIVEDAFKAAEWISTALISSGYQADFSPHSLTEVDRFFEDHSLNGEAIPGGLLSEDLGMRLFALGSYVGEVIRRSRGGDWRGDDENPRAEIELELHLSNGTICWPIQKTMKRFREGGEDSLGAYGRALEVL